MARAKVYYNQQTRTTYDDGRSVQREEHYVLLYKDSGEVISYPTRNVVRIVESP